LPGDRGNWYPEWEQITIRSLASQLSGISRESMFTVLKINLKGNVLLTD
jgi:hypothetical protein